MKTLHLPDHIYQTLVEMGQAINTQDNRYTAKPYYYAVEEHDRVYGVDENFSSDGYIYVLKDNSELFYTAKERDLIIEYFTEKEILNDWSEEDIAQDIAGLSEQEAVEQREYLKEMFEEKVDELIEEYFDVVHYVDKKKYSNVFFTEKGVKDYIEGNRHNLNPSCDAGYVLYAHRNPEMELIVQLLEHCAKYPQGMSANDLFEMLKAYELSKGAPFDEPLPPVFLTKFKKGDRVKARPNLVSTSDAHICAFDSFMIDGKEKVAFLGNENLLFEAKDYEHVLKTPIIEQINALIKGSDLDTNLISDGYHTFGELYEHRCRLYIELCRWRAFGHDELDEDTIWASQLHSDGTSMEGWFLLGINKEKDKQITYHLPMKYWEEVTRDISNITILDKAPTYDGHTSADVLKRLQIF